MLRIIGLRKGVAWPPWWTHQRPLRGWHYNAQNHVGQFLFAHIVQICPCICPQVFGLSEMCWPRKKLVAPLQHIIMEKSFQQLVLDVIADIFFHSLKQQHYILIATYYITRWTEVPLKKVNDQHVINFLKHNIISKFSVLTSLDFDNATYFWSLRLYVFALENVIM